MYKKKEMFWDFVVQKKVFCVHMQPCPLPPPPPPPYTYSYAFGLTPPLSFVRKFGKTWYQGQFKKLTETRNQWYSGIYLLAILYHCHKVWLKEIWKFKFNLESICKRKFLHANFSCFPKDENNIFKNKPTVIYRKMYQCTCKGTTKKL